MARVKADLKEHARQFKHEAAMPTHVPPLVSTPLPPQAPVEPRYEQDAAASHRENGVFSSGCIDLTADDETEDEEEADEPFAPPPVVERMPTPEGMVETPEEEVKTSEEIVEATLSEEELEVAPEEEEEEEEVLETPSFMSGDDESDVDEEMPQLRATGVASSVSRVGAVVINRLSLLVPSLSLFSTKECESREEEEEDERWPALQADAASVRTHDDEMKTVEADDASTASEEEGSAEDELPPVRVAVQVGGSLEDGEIFEEGAVAKSPSAVKEAIAQELLVARAAGTANKKKQKKRGRKKNKRKAEALVADEDIDEFGRNVRHQSMDLAAAMAMAPPQRADLPPTLAFPSLSSAPPAAIPFPSLMGTPPRPPLPPPLPMGDFAAPRGPLPPPFVDEQIVRVNRHGDIESFAYRHRVQPPFPPPVAPPPPPSMGGGFRYMSPNHFSMRLTERPAPNRGIKRHLPNPLDAAGRADDSDDGFDLDSLRAAALRTKRKSAVQENGESANTVPSEPSVEAASNEKSPAPTASASPEATEEEDASLDALRMELLKTMRRKRQESSQSVSRTVETKAENAGHKKKTSSLQKGGGKQAALDPKPVSPAPSIAKPLVVKALAVPAPPVQESPQFRPLTAMSQSLVIRLSLDDLAERGSKLRADSYDEAASRFGKVREDVRAAAASDSSTLKPQTLARPPVSVQRSTTTPVASQLSATAKPFSPSKSLETACTDETGEAGERACDNGEEKAGGAAEQGESLLPAPSTERPVAEGSKISVREVAVVPQTEFGVGEEVLADPVKLEAELRASEAGIREADTALACLDAEIAALRVAIASKEATSANPSSATACGA